MNKFSEFSNFLIQYWAVGPVRGGCGEVTGDRRGSPRHEDTKVEGFFTTEVDEVREDALNG